MINSSQFDLLVYNKPDHSAKGEEIDPQSVLGIDSEALTTGEPFLYCISDGRKIYGCERIHIIEKLMLFYSNKNFCVYNLKYDSGAFLYWIPDARKDELWRSGKTYYEWQFGKDFLFKNLYYDRSDILIEYEKPVRGILIEYIPHKNLRLTNGSDTVNFWDIAQFYKSSLDEAAKTYLGKRKNDIETKSFTPSYVKNNLKKICRYCLQDANLTESLGIFLIEKLGEFGIRTTALYSNASLSYRYFADRDAVCDTWRFWNSYKPLLKYALDAYEGGKFEVTARGVFSNAYQYDIVSAYPYHISNLVDVTFAKVKKSARYEPEAVYGFIRVRINNYKGMALPCGIMSGNVRIYPAGVFHVTVTKEELEFLIKWDVEHTIISGYWLFVNKKVYPYRKVIDQLFELKSRYKGKDVMLTNCSKIMMNSFYGKLCQCVDLPNKDIRCGQAWNPIHAAIITANTRIQVSEIQNIYKEECIAVHTDSVLLLKEKNLDSCDPSIDGMKKQKTGIGEFELQESGDGVLIACGQYEIGDKCAFKGIDPKDGDSWINILSRAGERQSIQYEVLHVESWIEAVAKRHYKKINLFANDKKEIDFNADTKRVWLENTNAKKLLTELQISIPHILKEVSEPEIWRE